MKALSRVVVVVAVLAFIVPRSAIAGPLTDQVRDSIDTVLKVVSDSELKKDARTAERRRMIRQVAGELFDFTEISARSLGPLLGHDPLPRRGRRRPAGGRQDADRDQAGDR